MKTKNINKFKTVYLVITNFLKRKIMSIFTNETTLTSHLNASLTELQNYCELKEGDQRYTEQSKSANFVSKNDKVFQFTFLGKEFCLLSEIRSSIGTVYLNLYQNNYDFENYPNIILTPIPKMTIEIDIYGNRKLAIPNSGQVNGFFIDTSVIVENFGERYFLELVKSIIELESK